ncbi:alkaline phosphatase D family protein [Allokutzneria sp. A3M-2-11 16]|uniref:alkaline phosphatase D family protein n=1 Tax=Allokutzneria sp. A3M-2-11 16 TaxID=2962043 RepID=UPI0020B7BE0C|nr:alkaline phosphatase D family protein [Allokutzneria sp. A3M-2-11 16]MCP3800640.1 alkaline phosphatase D family protein [Allokutzneria sp. A3M-2-11 16]
MTRNQTRRKFLTASGVAAGLAISGALPGIGTSNASTVEVDRLRDYPFRLGIASGDPLPDSVVLWTRLAPHPLDPFGGVNDRPVAVVWQVAEDERFRRVVRTGVEIARRESSHSVHVDVRGLRPWRHYYYRFIVGGHISPVGRTRTAPAPRQALSGMTFAFASCQAWWEGFYTAYRDMAAKDHDVVLHLGDYIYEYGVGADSGVRRQPVPVELTRETMTLDEYRGRYALYKTDPDLQAAHAAAPWVVTVDDHEVENNWAGPISENNAPREEFLVRMANAFRAWYEHTPVRLAQAPNGPGIQLYRRFQYGDLVRFNLLDTRQYRDDQAGGDGEKPPNPGSLDPKRSITGAAQEKWLLDGMAERSARWEVLAHQTAIAQLDVKAGPDMVVPMDTWDGYVASRKRILGGARERGVRNLVSIAGDLHRSVASELREDYAASTPVVGTEFVGTSVTSGRDGMDHDQIGRTILAENPHVKFHNFQRGYVRCEVNAAQWVADYRVADRVTVADGTVSSRSKLIVEDGVPAIQVR